MKLSVVILPAERWTRASAMWRRADEYGLHAAYTYDHLSWRSFRDRTWFSMVPTLAAAAVETTSLRLGPLVTTPNFRHPLLLAKDLLALDDISDGRISIGLGSGGTGFDATVLGQPSWSSDERHRRFEEFTRTLDQLLRESVSNLPGPFYPIVDSRQFPGPRQQPRPPIYVSALGPKTLALAAEMADGWVSFGHPGADRSKSTYDSVRAQLGLLEELLEARGRVPGSMERVLLDFEGDERPLDSYAAFIDWAGRYNELGMSEVVVHWPIPDSEYDCDSTVFERIATEGRATLATWAS